MVKYKKGGLVLLIKGCSNWLALKKRSGGVESSSSVKLWLRYWKPTMLNWSGI